MNCDHGIEVGGYCYICEKKEDTDMHLYLVYRIDSAEWNKYFWYIVRAVNKEHAFLLVRGRSGITRDNVTIEIITETGKEGIILNYYNAG